MKFRWIRILPVMAISAACVFPALLQAQTLCDPGSREQEEELIRSLPPVCKRERVQASGRVSFNIINSAEKIANEAWRREAVTKFGERFAEVQYMACRRVLCVRGSISGTHRCTISGFPCAADMTEQDKAQIRQVDMSQGPAPYESNAVGAEDVRSAYGHHRGAERTDLDENDIRRLQELLGVAVDGEPGPQTTQALREFRRSAGLRVDGPPSREDLDRLSKGDRRRGNWR